MRTNGSAPGGRNATEGVPYRQPKHKSLFFQETVSGKRRFPCNDQCVSCSVDGSPELFWRWVRAGPAPSVPPGRLTRRPRRPAAHPSDYWIGLECVPVEPALRSQLGLAEHQGLMVASVMPESPAAKAGIKPYDVLVKAGDKPLRGLKTLVEAVDASKDKPLALELFRGGKSEKIDVTPAKRPGEIQERWETQGPLPGGGDWEQMRKWIERNASRAWRAGRRCGCASASPA